MHTIAIVHMHRIVGPWRLAQVPLRLLLGSHVSHCVNEVIGGASTNPSNKLI
jgi:hypothetical protein